MPDPKPAFFRILEPLSTRIKDAGTAIRHSRGRILFYTAGSRNGLEGVGSGGPPLQNGSVWAQNQRNQGFNFLEVRKSDVFPPEADASMLAGKF